MQPPYPAQFGGLPPGGGAALTGAGAPPSPPRHPPGQPIRLARFPGDALHAMPAYGPMGSPYTMMAPPPMQAFQPHAGMVPPMLPPGTWPGAPPQQEFGAGYAQQGGMGRRSGTTTPKGVAGSGSATPTMHPMQRMRSGGQLPTAPMAPGYAPWQAPPGIVALPGLLPPGPPAMMHSAPPSAPGSRAHSAPLLAQPRRQPGSPGGAMASMQPLPAARMGTSRVGSAGSLRSSLDLGDGGSPLPHDGGFPFSAPASKAPSVAGSRARSAGQRSTPLREPDEADNIKVAVRVRPPNDQELARGDVQAVFVNPHDFRQVQVAVPGAYSRNGMPASREFTFHAALGPDSRQQDVLRLCGIPQLLDAAMDGFNATVLAYGQTGSGKTFTMSGREDELLAEGYLGDGDEGIVARSLKYLFDQLARRTSGAGPDGGAAYSLRVSLAEIYNEQIYDLIRFDKKQLPVRWDATKGFHVPGMFCKDCATVEDALEVLALGVRHRRVGSHELNMESSRSHSLLTVYVDCTVNQPDDPEHGLMRHGKVSFVDLAGSERLRDSKSSGVTLKETTNINRSLFMLGKVIAALADGAQGARVPYRESKLTKLLMDSLGGSALTLFIACCSPSAANIEETLSTLGYATRAKNIRNQPMVQMDPEQAALAALKREVKLLRSENAYLREQLCQVNMRSGAAAAPSDAPGSQLGSRQPSRSGPPAGTPSAPGQLLPVGGAPGEPTPAAAGASRPASGAAGGGPSMEQVMRRLVDMQQMLVQVSHENERLAAENGRLRSGKALVANDYSGALHEIDWLQGRLESLESTLLSLLDEGGRSRAGRLLETARSVLGNGGGAGIKGLRDMLAEQQHWMDQLQQGVAGGEAGGEAEGVSQGPAEDAAAPREEERERGSALASLEPLASQLAAAAQSAAAAAADALAEAPVLAADSPAGKPGEEVGSLGLGLDLFVGEAGAAEAAADAPAEAGAAAAPAGAL